MILMAAPGYAPNMVFAGAPSGDVYQSNQFGLIYVGSGGVPDQLFLQGAGCATLTPFGNYQPPALSAWKLAATGCSIASTGDLTGATFVNKKIMAVRAHWATCALSGVVKLVYANWEAQPAVGDYYDTDGTLGFGAVTGTCSIAYPDKSTIIGTGSFVVQPGQNAAVAVALSASIPAGAKFYVGTYATPQSGRSIPVFPVPYANGLNTTSQSLLNGGAGEASNYATSGVTDQTANLSAVSGTGYAWGPSAILALQPASTPVAAIWSDSTEYNFYYETDTQGNIGWFAQALGAVGIPCISYSGAGKSAAVEAGSIISPCPLQGQWAGTMRGQFSALIGVTDSILDLGVNDMGDVGPISNAKTAATVEGYWSTIITNLLVLGHRITGVTIKPTTTSSDSWVTTANQTVSPNNTQIDLFNAYVRAKPSGVTFVVDAGAAVGTGTSSAKWNVGSGGAAPWTADGIHPYDRALGNLIGAVNVANYAAVLPATGLGYADTYNQGIKSVQSALDLAISQSAPAALTKLTADADYTVVPYTTTRKLWDNATLTADRKLVLASTGLPDGYTIRLSRPGSLGSHNRKVYQPDGTTLIKSVADGGWVDVEWSSTASLFIESAAGSL